MQSASKMLNLSHPGKNFIRTIAINSASANEVETNAELKSWREIPGPPSYPIVGQLPHLLPGSELGDMKTFQEKLYKKYGPIARLDAILGRPAFIFLYDPEAIEMILRNENKLPIRPGFQSLEYFRKHYKKSSKEEKPTGLITDHGDLWKQFRTTVNPVMLQPKTIKLYSSALEEVADDMIKRMRSKLNDKNMIEGKFDDEMNLWALESIAIVALGGRIGCLDADLPEDSPAKKLIQCAHDFFHISNELDFKPSLGRIFATPLFKKAMKLYEEQENISKYFLKKAMEDIKNNKKNSEDEKGVLEKLLEIDEEAAVIMANDMLFAGVDTSATTVTAALYLLAINPEKQERLREELTSGTDKKTYLKSVVKETLRVMPVVGGNMRVTTKEYNVLGYRIPKGIAAISCQQYLSSMEEQYPRSKEFIPERWFEKDSPLYYTSAHPFSYAPFGFGVRSCIGRRIAELEIETFLSKLIKNFKVEWFGPPGIEVEPGALNQIKGPYNFIFKDV